MKIKVLIKITFLFMTQQSFGQQLSTGPSGFSLGSNSNESGEFSKIGLKSNEYVGGYYPGAIMMTVNVWGAIKSTGLFRVPKTTTLVELLSYAQGPSSDAKLHKVKIKRTAEKIEKTFTVDVQELIENPAAHDIPLMAKDIVYIEPKLPYLIDPQITSTITVVASVLGIVATAYIIKQRGSIK